LLYFEQKEKSLQVFILQAFISVDDRGFEPLTSTVSKMAEGNFHLYFLELSAIFELFTANCLNWLNNIVLLWRNRIVTSGAKVSRHSIMNLNLKH
jgi:hypothetical protein